MNGGDKCSLTGLFSLSSCSVYWPFEPSISLPSSSTLSSVPSRIDRIWFRWSPAVFRPSSCLL